MKKYILLFVVGLLTTVSVFAQNAGEKSIQKGYKGSVEIGFAAGAGETAHNKGELIVVNGYQFNEKFSAGIGVGIQVWQVTQQVTLPIFADFETTFMQKTISPFANIRLGYCIGLSEDFVLPKDGVYFSPTIGFRWGILNNKALKLGTGYLLQGSKIKQNYNTPNQFTENFYFHSLVAKIIFEF